MGSFAEPLQPFSEPGDILAVPSLWLQPSELLGATGAAWGPQWGRTEPTGATLWVHWHHSGAALGPHWNCSEVVLSQLWPH